MNDQRVYADLNKWEEVNGEFRIILTTRGTFEDLQKYNIMLEEGLVLNFWMDDGDDEGNFDPLYFQGTLHFDGDKRHWVAAIDREKIFPASALRSAETMHAGVLAHSGAV